MRFAPSVPAITGSLPDLCIFVASFYERHEREVKVLGTPELWMYIDSYEQESGYRER